MPDYKDMTNEDFDRILSDIINDDTASNLLTIPGIYEILAEHYNNEVLDAWTEEKEEAKGKPIEDFINENRETIDAAILTACPNCTIDDDDEREKWILNDEGLYNWARAEGVKI